MATSPFVALQNIVSLALDRWLDSESHPRSWIIWFTLISGPRLYSPFPFTNLAALRCTRSKLSTSFCFNGSHTHVPYSRPDRTRSVYESSLRRSGHLWRFLCRKPSISLAFVTVFAMCRSKVVSSESSMPRRLGTGWTCRILTSLNQCGSHPQIPGRSLTGMTASLSYCGDVCTQSSVVRPLVFFPHLKRDTQRLWTCRSSLSPSP